MFGLFVLFVYEPFRLSHQEDDAAGVLCSKFNSDLRRKNVVLDELRVTHLMNPRCFHFKDQAGMWLRPTTKPAITLVAVNHFHLC